MVWQQWVGVVSGCCGWVLWMVVVKHSQWANDIAGNGGEVHDGGRLWFRGATMPNDLPEEFDEDASFHIQDLSQVSER